MIASTRHAVAVHQSSGRRRFPAIRVYRWLAFSLLVTLPLVSFPYLPGVSATAVAPASLVFALAIVAVHLLREPRAVRLPLWLLLPALVGLIAVLVSYLPVVVDIEAYTKDPDLFSRRIARAVLPVAAAAAFVAAFFVLMRSPAFGPAGMGRAVMVAARVHAVVALMALATAAGTPIITEAYQVLRNVLTTSGSTPIGGLKRVAALAFEPSFAGFEYVGWWLPLALALTSRRSTRRTGWGLVAVFGGAAVGTVTVTAAVSMFVVGGLAALFAMVHLRTPLRRALFLWTAIAALAVAPLVPPVAVVASRVTDQLPAVASGEILRVGPRDPSLAVRSALLHNAVNVALAYPLTGAGFGLAGYRFADHRPSWTYVNPYRHEYVGYLENPDGAVFPSAKNLYVRLWSEAGPVALLALLFVVVAGFLRALRMVNHRHAATSVRWIALAAVFGIGGSAAAYLSLDSFGVPYLWAWLGIVAGSRST